MTPHLPLSGRAGAVVGACLVAALLGSATVAHAQLVLTGRSVSGTAGGQALVVPAGAALDAPLEVHLDGDYTGPASGRITTHSALQSSAMLGAGSVALALNADASWTQAYSGAAAGQWASASAQGSARWDLDLLQATQLTVSVLSSNIGYPNAYGSVSFSRVLADGSLGAALPLGGGMLLDAGHYAVSLNTYASSSALEMRGSTSYARSNLVKLTLTGQFTTAVASVPEPGTWALMGLGLLAMGMVSRRRQGT